MKKRRCCLYLLLGVVLLCVIPAALAWKPYRLRPSDVNACAADSDCIIVPPVGCGYPSSINKSNLDLWKLHQKLQRFPPIIGACAPSPPADAFQPECLQNACRAVTISEHAMLEFPLPPVLGEPADLTFTVKVASDMEAEIAKLEFTPNLVAVQQGDTQWEGALSAGEEMQMGLTILVPRPGYYQIHGEALASNGYMMQDDLDFLITEEGVHYGKKPVNRWDITHFAYPVGEEDSRLFRELVFDPVPALDQQTTVVYRVRSEIGLEFADMQMVLPPGGFEILEAAYPPGGEHGEIPRREGFFERVLTGMFQPLHLWWRGPVRAGETLEIRAEVKAVEQGWGIAYGLLRSAELPDNVISAFVYVDEYNGYYEIREGP